MYTIPHCEQWVGPTFGESTSILHPDLLLHGGFWLASSIEPTQLSVTCISSEEYQPIMVRNEMVMNGYSITWHSDNRKGSSIAMSMTCTIDLEVSPTILQASSLWVVAAMPMHHDLFLGDIAEV